MMNGVGGRQRGGGAMEHDSAIVGILTIGFMNHGPSIAELPNWGFDCGDFR